ncbi:MAG: response regulator transcription factor [Clostridiales bacterium]|nr:response regulator transcription factor [Clostridiales bacterium]
MIKKAKKVLIVDDEVKILEVVKAFLENKGYEVYTAENGHEAFALLQREEIALVLLDLMLPEISGEQICMEIRRKSRIPIIMLTAKADEADILEGLEIGADDYIKKPFSLKELHARIEAVLRRSTEDILFHKGSFNDGDLEIDVARRRVLKGGSEIKLTMNEFRILTSLVRYPNKVFTRDELVLAALGDEFEGYNRAIDSHIKNIRQKIESDPKNPVYLLTVHGIGYKFGGR